ncbi:MAG: hypothetical protein OQJ89_05435, partial [Kangiellaceae bacterium]|nr:hypothetical protein [Kangiellaceae bacterium]
MIFSSLLSIQEFLLAVIYSLSIGGCVFAICSIFEKTNSPILAWREFWLVASGFVMLPFMIGLIPNPLQHWSQFNIGSLSGVFETASSQISIQKPAEVLEKQQINFSTFAYSLLVIYLIGLAINLIRFAQRLVCLSRIIKRSTPVSPAI